MGSSSAKKAARAQASAIREATALQRQMYNTTRKDLAGYRDLGSTGLQQMNQGLPEMTRSFTASDFVKDPGYDFRMQEGAKALERSAAARGGLMGGAAGKAMARYGQDYASNEYQNVYNRFNQDRDQRFNKLSSLINVGQNSATQTGNFAQNYANNAGQAMMAGGDAQAASQIAQGNAWTGAINQGIGAAYAFGGQQNNDVNKLGNIAGNYTQPTNMSELIKRTA
jgi:hypothetical protein